MKSSTELQQDITVIEQQLIPIKRELDRHISEFAADLPPQVKKWMAHEVKNHVEQNSEKVMSQGADFARAVKSDLERLYSQLEQLCQTAVGPIDSWPHNKAVNSELQMPQRSNESFFASSFRCAISHLGAILHKHGLLESRGGSLASWKQVHGSGFQYAYNPGFSDRDNPAAVKYNATKTKYDQLASNLLSKRKELEHAKARELWDEA